MSEKAPMQMLGAALEREHHEIDEGIKAFLTGLAEGAGDAASLTQAMQALRRHIFLEEEFVFPPLRERQMVAIFVMVRDHGELWRTMDTMDAQLVIDATGASMSDVCRELLAQLERHNAKEEPIVYAEVDTTLTAEAAARLRAFLAEGHTPEGWVCAGARPR